MTVGCEKLHFNSPTRKISSRIDEVNHRNETEPAIISPTTRSDRLLTLQHSLDESSSRYDIWLTLIASPALPFWIYRWCRLVRYRYIGRKNFLVEKAHGLTVTIQTTAHHGKRAACHLQHAIAYSVTLLLLSLS